MNKSNSLSIASGFSLIEVLVALVILSVGMLGILTLQVKGLQFSQNAMTNTQAVNTVSDMADRIRANPGATAAYAATFGAAGAEPGTKCADTDGIFVAVVCTPPAMAAYDLWQWKIHLQDSANLPNGDGAIVVDTTTTPVTYSIEVKWTERGEELSHLVRIQ